MVIQSLTLFHAQKNNVINFVYNSQIKLYFDMYSHPSIEIDIHIRKIVKRKMGIRMFEKKLFGKTD